MLIEIGLGVIVFLGLIVLAGPRLLLLIADGVMRAEMKRARALAPADTDPLLADLDPAVPALLYFTADWCAPCKTTQSPIIERLMARYGAAVQLRKIDVQADPDGAKRWGVQSLPRTVVLRAGRHIHATNLGVATEQTLSEQIESAQTAEADRPMVVTREELGNKRGFKVRAGG